jgi:hypothetical protein
MPLRDDQEAARARIEALERELADTKVQAERAIAEANERADVAERARRPTVHGRGKPASASRSDAGWPGRRRFALGAAFAVALVDLPVLVLFAGWRWDLDDADGEMFRWLLPPLLSLPPVIYLLARWARAPFPGSAALSSLLANGVGWMALAFGATDMLWGDLLAEPPWRWVSRGVTGLAAIAIHALVVSQWCGEAALSKTSAGD